MDAVITIDGKRVPIRKTAGTMQRYKTATGREWNADIDRFFMLKKELEAVKTDDEAKANEERLSIFLKADTGWMYDAVYIMAKQAAPELPPMEEWLDGFDSFRVWDVFQQVLPLLLSEMQVSPKND